MSHAKGTNTHLIIAIHHVSNCVPSLPQHGSDCRRHLRDVDVVRVGLGDLGHFVHGGGQEETHLGRLAVGASPVADGDRGRHGDLHLLLVLRRLEDSDVGGQPPEEGKSLSVKPH